MAPRAAQTHLYPDILFPVATQSKPPTCDPLQCRRSNWRPEAAQYVTDAVITLYVGTPATEFKVHKLLLTSGSFFFKAALTNSNYIETESNAIRLPEDDPAAFTLLVNWLYSDVFRRAEPESDITISEYLKIYTTADKYGMPDCQDVITDEIRKNCSHNLIDEIGMCQISDTLIPEGTKLEQFFIDRFAHELVFNTSRYRDPTTCRLRRQWDQYFMGPEKSDLSVDVLAAALDLRRLWLRTPPKTRQSDPAPFRNPMFPIDCRYHDTEHVEHVEEKSDRRNVNEESDW